MDLIGPNIPNWIEVDRTKLNRSKWTEMDHMQKSNKFFFFFKSEKSEKKKKKKKGGNDCVRGILAL